MNEISCQATLCEKCYDEQIRSVKTSSDSYKEPRGLGGAKYAIKLYEQDRDDLVKKFHEIEKKISKLKVKI